jgi:hypothetical protein
MRKSITTPDPITEFVTLEIDGKKYRLAADFNAIAEAESGAGCNLLHGISATLMNTMNMAQLRGLLYALMLRDAPATTLADAGKLIRLDTMPDIVEKISTAFALSMPKKKENPTGAVSATANS